ncbi:MAG: D-2-hydroxyacid dehydrogenase [Lachnospiraceae bacterium]|nr:D-2-hydroxyacid dehydrogenase [Lachnospiraceae bacterium]
MKIAVIYEQVDGLVLEYTENEVNMIKQACPNDEVVFFKNYGEAQKAGFRADVMCTALLPRPKSEPNEVSFGEYLIWAGTVKWVHSCFAGVDKYVVVPELMNSDIILTSSSGIHAYQISDHVLAFILCWLRKFPQAFKAKEKHQYLRFPKADETTGKTIGIIGVGKIGSELAHKAHALHMHVLGYKRTPADVEGVDQMFFGDELDDMLEQCDFVACLLPKTDETYHILNAERFSHMKPEALFINCGRGSCVDTEALIEALKNGVIAGAALDVFEEEPLPEDSPLWDIENVMLTAHYAGDSVYSMQRATQIFIDNMELYLKGQKLQNQIEK